jgi:hypothetical protein
MNEKEKLAQWMIEHGFGPGRGETLDDLLKELERMDSLWVMEGEIIVK